MHNWDKDVGELEELIKIDQDFSYLIKEIQGLTLNNWPDTAKEIVQTKYSNMYYESYSIAEYFAEYKCQLFFAIVISKVINSIKRNLIKSDKPEATLQFTGTITDGKMDAYFVSDNDGNTSIVEPVIINASRNGTMTKHVGRLIISLIVPLVMVDRESPSKYKVNYLDSEISLLLETGKGHDVITTKIREFNNKKLSELLSRLACML